MAPAAKKVLEEAVKPNRRKRSRREHVGGSAPIGCGHARELSPKRHSRLRAKVPGSDRSRADNSREYLVQRASLGSTDASNLGCHAEVHGSREGPVPYSVGWPIMFA
jgi:hypothetical protein